MRIRVLIICSLVNQIWIGDGRAIPSLDIAYHGSQKSNLETAGSNQDNNHEFSNSDTTDFATNFERENENSTEWIEGEVNRQMEEIKSELKTDERIIAFVFLGLFIITCAIKGCPLLALWIYGPPPKRVKHKGSEDNSTKDKSCSNCSCDSPRKKTRDKNSQKLKPKKVLLTVPLPNLSEQVKCDIQADV